MPKQGQSVYPELNNCNFLRQKYLEDEQSSNDIAKEVGCSNGAVLRALKRCNITLHIYHQELYDPAFLQRKYWEEEQTKAQIAKCIGCGRGSISKAFKRFGIPTRTKSECAMGRNNGMYGKHHSEETRQKIRDGVGKAEKNHIFGKPFTEEHKQRIGEAHRNPTEETRRKLREATKGENNGMYGKHPSEEARQKMSDIGKKHWQDPNYVKKIIKGWNIKPNKAEKMMDEMLQKILPEEYMYNGDFSCGITIGGKIPDFVNVNGRKIVIEVFGPWHDKQYMKQYFNSEISWGRTEIGTKAIYSQFGFKCIIFWESDLKRKDAEQFVLSKLKRSGALMNNRSKIEEWKQRKEFTVG